MEFKVVRVGNSQGIVLGYKTFGDMRGKTIEINVKHLLKKK